MRTVFFKIGHITLTLLCCTAVAIAQNQAADSLVMLYNNYFKLEASSQKMTTKVEDVDSKLAKLDKSIGGIGNEIKHLGENLNSSLEKVNRLTEDDILSKQSRLNTQKEKIIKTCIYVGHASNSFDALDAALAQSDYLSDITKLNNPTNTDLGFSLSDDITILLKQKIIKGNSKFNGRKVGKFLEFVKNIIKNPIVTSITSAIPAVSAISSVVDLVSGIAVRERGVSVKDFTEFKRALDKYIVHYNGLAKANHNFNTNIQNLKIKLEALRTVMNNYTLERIRTINPNANINTDQEMYKVIATYYDPTDIQRYINDILKQYEYKNGEVNYTPALNDKRLSYPFYAINQAQFIRQELESLTNEYISSYKDYHKAIKKVLEKSKPLSKKPEKINQKLELLTQKLGRLVSTFEKNVKIDRVNIALQEIPTI